MTIFQVVALTFIAAMIGLSVLKLTRVRARPLISAMWLILWIVAAVAVASPDSTTVVARHLGIVRGADLIFYCAVLFGFVGFFFAYVRMRRLEREVTILVRQIAVTRADVEKIVPTAIEPPR